jgi:hypothetical protein
LVFLRPILVLRIDKPVSKAATRRWIKSLVAATQPEALVLNVAGPRESEVPGIQARARELLREIVCHIPPD